MPKSIWKPATLSTTSQQLYWCRKSLLFYSSSVSSNTSLCTWSSINCSTTLYTSEQMPCCILGNDVLRTSSSDYSTIVCRLLCNHLLNCRLLVQSRVPHFMVFFNVKNFVLNWCLIIFSICPFAGLQLALIFQQNFPGPYRNFVMCVVPFCPEWRVWVGL